MRRASDKEAADTTCRRPQPPPLLVAARRAVRILFFAALLTLTAAQSYTGPPPELSISPKFITEEFLRGRDVKEINFTLLGGGEGGWAPALETDDILAEQFIALVRADTRQPLGWQTTVSPYLRPHHLDLRENGLQLTLVLDGIDAYRSAKGLILKNLPTSANIYEGETL